jgi:hypothetical protein
MTPWLIALLILLPFLGAVIYLVVRLRVIHLEFGEPKDTLVIKGENLRKKLKN